MDYLPQFKTWLLQKGFSPSTSRNYLADIGKYLEFAYNTSTDSLQIFSPEILQQYLSHISDNNNNARYTASLKKFCQFALDQNLISQNPLKNVSRSSSIQSLLDQVVLFEKQLTTQNIPESVRQNNINNLYQYISWLETTKIEFQ